MKLLFLLNSLRLDSASLATSLSHRFCKYNLRLHYLSPAGLIHLCKYLWAMKSYDGEPYEEVFYFYHQVANSAKKIEKDGRIYKLEFRGCSFRPRKNEPNYFAPCSRNKWPDNFHQAWLYVKVPSFTRSAGRQEVVSYPLTSTLFECRPNNAGNAKSLHNNANNDVYLNAVCTKSGRDLVEEFIAASIWPLSAACGFSEFMEMSIPLVGGPVLFPVFAVDQVHFSEPDFADMVETRANILVGRYTLAEHNAILKKVSHQRRLN